MMLPADTHLRFPSLCASYIPGNTRQLLREGKRPEPSGALGAKGTNNSARRALTSNCITFRRRITEPHSITLGWIYPAVRAAVGGAEML
ncbi:MAG: hypothetical protein LBB72_01050 [Spirochaetaceae bacterium]|nr:hypothetical protein [Spirochaetaceae bacterium]